MNEDHDSKEKEIKTDDNYHNYYRDNERTAKKELKNPES
jgi:hypothetical protein